MEKKGTDIIPVFEALLKHVPAPHGDPEKSLQIQISSIHYNDYVGRIGVGRIYNGGIKTGQQVKVVSRDGKQINSKVQQVQVFDGLGRATTMSCRGGRHCRPGRPGVGGHHRQHLRSSRSAALGGRRRSSRRR